MGKKITIAADANPFDKTRTAAEQMFAPQPPSEAKQNVVKHNKCITNESHLMSSIFISLMVITQSFLALDKEKRSIVN